MGRIKIISVTLTLSASLLFIFLHVKRLQSSIVADTAQYLSISNKNKQTGATDDPLPSIVENCTGSEAKLLGVRYTQLVQQSNRWSACYSDDFLLRLYLADIGFPEHRNMLFFDVGANKGYSIATWISLWMPGLGISSRTLYEFLKTHSNLTDCGVCQDCREFSFETLQLRTQVNRTIEIHAFEPQPSTYVLLNRTRQWMNLSTFHTHQLALSNATSTGLLRKCPVGVEVCGLASKSDLESNKFLEVQTITLDQFVKQNRITRQIDLLKIDTEGFDPLVLQGADTVLRRHQVRLLLFEYHGIGMWQTIRLQQVVTDLDERGYICYQIGRTGLFRLTGCWSEMFEMKRWSNVLCLSKHESRLRIFIEELLIKL
jgi:FkbM family methyltransferase